jgi:hypothetical protein
VSGRVLRLPARGRLYVATDLQGNLPDFEAVVARFLDGGPDAQLVFTGDLIHGPDEATARDWPGSLGTPYRDESFAVVRSFIELQRRCPGRVHGLMGNHEHAHVGGPATGKFHPDEAAALEAELTDDEVAELRATLRGFPLVAVAPCGVVLLHGAPAAAVDGPDAIEAVSLDGFGEWSYHDFLEVPVLGPILWSRMATDAEAERFVKALGAEVAVFGHDIVRTGWSKDGPRQLCLSTSFALHDREKTYLELDLAGRYRSTDDFAVGRELKALYPSSRG